MGQATELLANKRSSVDQGSLKGIEVVTEGGDRPGLKGATELGDDHVMTSKAAVIKQLSQAMSHTWATDIIAKRSSAPDVSVSVKSWPATKWAKPEAQSSIPLAIDEQLVNMLSRSSLLGTSDVLFQMFDKHGSIKASQVDQLSPKIVPDSLSAADVATSLEQHFSDLSTRFALPMADVDYDAQSARPFNSPPSSPTYFTHPGTSWPQERSTSPNRHVPSAYSSRPQERSTSPNRHVPSAHSSNANQAAERLRTHLIKSLHSPQDLYDITLRTRRSDGANNVMDVTAFHWMTRNVLRIPANELNDVHIRRVFDALDDRMRGRLELQDLVQFKQGRSAYTKQRLVITGDEGTYRGDGGRLNQGYAVKRHHRELARLEEPLTIQDEIDRGRWLNSMVPETNLTTRPTGAQQRWDQWLAANQQYPESRNGSACTSPKTPDSRTPGRTRAFRSPGGV